MMIRMKTIMMALFALLVVNSVVHAEAIESPVDLLKRTSDQVISVLKEKTCAHRKRAEPGV